MPDLCVFACNPDPLLIASATRLGISIAGYEIPWRGHVESKLREGVKFLAGRTEPFAMFVDGFDSLILKPESEIVARIETLGFTTLIAAETHCWPDVEFASRFHYGPAPRFLNSGGYIGSRANLLTAMHTAIQWATTEDDQRAWTAAYVAGVLNIQIDHGRRIFCSQGDGETESADPCVRHWNGRSPGREEFWEYLRA